MSGGAGEVIRVESMEEAGVGGGDRGESAAVLDRRDGCGVGLLGLDLEGHLVGEDPRGGVLPDHIGALWDRPDRAVSGQEFDLVGGRLEGRPQARGQSFEDESGPAQEARGGVVAADRILLAFGLEEDQAAVAGDRVPEVEADEEPGRHHLSGLGHDQEGMSHPQDGQFEEVFPGGEAFDRVDRVVAVEGPAEMGQEDPRVASGQGDQDMASEGRPGTYAADECLRRGSSREARGWTFRRGSRSCHRCVGPVRGIRFRGGPVRLRGVGRRG